MKAFLFVCLLAVARGSPATGALAREKRAYYGPPAPLNSDGSVAQTNEFNAAAAGLAAAHSQEHQKLAAAASLAAAHPDNTSPPESWNAPQQQSWTPPQQSWNAPQQQQQWNQPQQQSWNAPQQKSWTPPQQQSWNAPQQSWTPPQQSWNGQYNPTASKPAPLNPDGTVAQTPEFQALAASHAQAHARGKRSPSYYGPPAPLNHDGSVAQTPEVAAAAAGLAAAHSQEHQRLAAAAALAAAHPDTTSPQGESWNQPSWNAPQQSWNAPQQSWNAPQQSWNAPQQSWSAPQQSWNGQYNPHASQPAPLNPDGTVAQTPEYTAIAAAHSAAHYQNAPAAPHWGRKRRSAPLNPDGTVAHTPEVAAATAAHLAALSGASVHGAALPYSPFAAPFSYVPSPLSYAHAPLSYAPAPLIKFTPPAPLNHDGTVAETPEVAAASAAHHAAHAQQLSSLSAQSHLAIAAGPENSGHYVPGVVAYHGVAPLAYHAPAPLNHDGTVAQTPEYLAVAASHAAAHHG